MNYGRGFSQVTDTMTDSDMHHTVLLVLVSRCVCCDLCLSVLYISALQEEPAKMNHKYELFTQVWTTPSLTH